MPDLFVHTVSGYLLFRPKWQGRFLLPVFLLGCIYPDLVRGPMLIVLNIIDILGMHLVHSNDLMSLRILHSPIPLFVQVWLLSFLFEEDIRKKAFVSLLGGVILHLLLDAGQRAYHISYLWLFPFSFDNPIPGLWWADENHWLTLLVIIVGGCVYICRSRRGVLQ